MRTDIWGNVFLYCQEHNISFNDTVIPTIEEHILSNYKNNDKNSYLSTLESDVSILVNELHIPLQEIFSPQNRDERIIKLCKDKWMFDDEINVHQDYNCCKWSTTCRLHSDTTQVYAIPYITMNKYMSFKDLTTDYWIDIEFHYPDYNYKKNHVDFLTQNFIGRSFIIYNGQSGKVPNYIDAFYNKNNWINDITDEEIAKTPYNTIDFKDVIVKSSLRKCSNENHQTHIVNGIIYILNNISYEIIHEIIPLIYCPECNAYFMYEDNYNAVARKGRLMCHVYNLKEWKNRKSNNTFSHLSTESIFKLCGYTVNAVDDITDIGRHNLLKFMIQRNIVTLPKTLNFLHWLIDTRKDMPHMYEAVKKWKSDLEFLEKEYNSNNNVIVNTIITMQ